MPVIEQEITIDAPVERVYAIAKDVESFPSFMPDVESVVVRERSEDSRRTLTEWVGLIPEFKQKIRWTEEDLWDDSAFVCTFHQTKGEYKEYDGKWSFTPVAGGTLFRSAVNYDIEIPLIGPLLKRLVAKKMQDNIDKILSAIKARAESQA